MDRSSLVKYIFVVMLMCCASIAFAQLSSQVSGPSVIGGVGPGFVPGVPFSSGRVISPYITGSGILLSSGPAPPTCAGTGFNFALACNSQYLVMGGLL